MSKFDLTTPGGRTRTYLDYLWNDLAYLRASFTNAHWVSPELVRTNQPWPHQLAYWKRQGVETIVNLRGGFDASFHALEKDGALKSQRRPAGPRTRVYYSLTSRGMRRLFDLTDDWTRLHGAVGAVLKGGAHV